METGKMGFLMVSEDSSMMMAPFIKAVSDRDSQNEERLSSLKKMAHFIKGKLK